MTPRKAESANAYPLHSTEVQHLSFVCSTSEVCCSYLLWNTQNLGAAPPYLSDVLLFPPINLHLCTPHKQTTPSTKIRYRDSSNLAIDTVTVVLISSQSSARSTCYSSETRLIYFSLLHVRKRDGGRRTQHGVADVSFPYTLNLSLNFASGS